MRMKVVASRIPRRTARQPELSTIQSGAPLLCLPLLSTRSAAPALPAGWKSTADEGSALPLLLARCRGVGSAAAPVRAPAARPRNWWKAPWQTRRVARPCEASCLFGRVGEVVDMSDVLSLGTVHLALKEAAAAMAYGLGSPQLSRHRGDEPRPASLEVRALVVGVPRQVLPCREEGPGVISDVGAAGAQGLVAASL